MTNKTKIKRLRLWVAALRSGKYTKTKGQLYRPLPRESHCPLGVAHEVKILVTTGHRPRWDEFTQRNGKMPWATSRWYGLDDGDPYVMESPPLSTAELNDGSYDRRPVSFRRIADMIERRLIKPLED